MPGATVSITTRKAARFQDPAHAGEPGAEILPVVGAEARDDDIEARVVERKRFRRTAPRVDIAEAARARLVADGCQHLGGKVVGHDLADMWGDGEGDVTAAAAEIEHARIGTAAHQPGQPFEIRPGRVIRAFDVGARVRAELIFDQGVVTRGHECLQGFTAPGLAGRRPRAL